MLSFSDKIFLVEKSDMFTHVMQRSRVTGWVLATRALLRESTDETAAAPPGVNSLSQRIQQWRGPATLGPANWDPEDTRERYP